MFFDECTIVFQTPAWFPRIMMSRILLSINLNFGRSMKMYISPSGDLTWLWTLVHRNSLPLSKKYFPYSWNSLSEGNHYEPPKKTMKHYYLLINQHLPLLTTHLRLYYAIPVVSYYQNHIHIIHVIHICIHTYTHIHVVHLCI